MGDNIKTGAIRPHPENQVNSVYQPPWESADSEADSLCGKPYRPKKVAHVLFLSSKSFRIFIIKDKTHMEDWICSFQELKTDSL